MFKFALATALIALSFAADGRKKRQIPGFGAGISGINGLTGLNGVKGISGLNGLTGLNGVNGLTGINGLNGVTGLNGIPGLNGVTGLTGINGLNGVNGFPGLNGISGLNGLNGLFPSNGLNLCLSVLDCGGFQRCCGNSFLASILGRTINPIFGGLIGRCSPICILGEVSL